MFGTAGRRELATAEPVEYTHFTFLSLNFARKTNFVPFTLPTRFSQITFFCVDGWFVPKTAYVPSLFRMASAAFIRWFAIGLYAPIINSFKKDDTGPQNQHTLISRAARTTTKIFFARRLGYHRIYVDIKTERVQMLDLINL